ncbi:MAG: NADH-quinone oxidoreductase subunit L [Armatimonadetes bacterium]|nr:NADH-quinone oxidoreductase subunit L [Armatimonadota bacterium]
MREMAWIIPILPFAASMTLLFFGAALKRRLGEGVAWIGVAGIAATLPFSLGVLYELVTGAPAYHASIPWAPVGQRVLDIGYQVDALTAVMLAMVSVVATCIMVFSVGYMHGDDGYQRFFAYMSLFCAAMFLLVLAANFIVLYVAWELVGLCSYLLIGFWFHKPEAANAAKKAFITTRIGDLFFALGIFLIWRYAPSLSFEEAFRAAAAGAMTASVAGLAALLLFGGAVGKSAQFPLHVWLPDAMEGPTPVSALIHAATMVAAGVYMVARLSPLYWASLHEGVISGIPALTFVAGIGLITALLAAFIGLTQNDIKRVLAYSTISQLGYMMCGLGMGVIGFAAGVFHLITHAFFKALLFLGSGSVMHAMHDELDMWKMGGLGRRMPVTYWTFWAGTLALAGIFPFAGFFSKDEIIAAAYHMGHEEGRWIYFLGLEAGAFLTALYMGRLCFNVFSGQPRTETAEHAHESPPVMLWPLRILAFFAIILGWVGSPWVANNLFHHFLTETAPAIKEVHVGFNPAVAALSTAMALGGLLLAAAMYRWHVLSPDVLKRPLWAFYVASKRKCWFDELYTYTVVGATVLGARLAAKFDLAVIDGLVNLVGWGTRVIVAQVIRWFDLIVVDGAVNLAALATGWVGEAYSRLQTGRAQDYVTGLAVFAATLAAAAAIAVIWAELGFPLPWPW